VVMSITKKEFIVGCLVTWCIVVYVTGMDVQGMYIFINRDQVAVVFIASILLTLK